MAANGRVLVVEDEVLIRMLAVDMLEELGYAPVEAGDGAGAKQLLGDGADYVVIFLDVGLPDIRGDELIRNVRDDGVTIPLLVASGEDPVELKQRLGEFSPIGFLPKPYSMEQLREALAALTVS